MSNPGNPRIPVQPTPLRHRLRHLANALASPRTAIIVAIGSSSTAGEGDVKPYPPLLEDLLRKSHGDVKVINKGQGGQEAADELARFKTDVLALKPDLVIWQVGTNAVWNGESPDRTILSVWRGLDLLASLRKPTDVILMDLQYVPALLTADRAPLAEQMVALIAEAAATARPPVNVFRRFAMMRAWHELEKISFDQIVHETDSLRLHQSKWATERLAGAVQLVIEQALQSSDNVPPAPSA
jgi:lysophospholipase L1-like esterase